MGIYGNAHIGQEYISETSQLLSMAGQLRRIYEEVEIQTEDLTPLAQTAQALQTEPLLVGGKEYQASCYGQQDISFLTKEFVSRTFWRLEGAYDDFKNNHTTGNVLPYNNYPLQIETGQVFVIEYIKTNGDAVLEYHRSDGGTWNGMPCTQEFTIK